MDNFSEVVKVFYSEAQNAALQDSFKEFYELYSAPKVEKVLFVTKSSYQRFLNRSMRERTPYESAKKFSEIIFNASNNSFEVMSSICTFKFPSGREMSLTEYLDKPNGIVKSVILKDSLSPDLSFSSYLYAEGKVLEEFLSEKGQLV